MLRRMGRFSMRGLLVVLTLAAAAAAWVGALLDQDRREQAAVTKLQALVPPSLIYA